MDFACHSFFRNLCFLAGLPCFVALSFATSFREQPFPDSVSDAPVIVRGKVGSSYANWVESPHFGRRIYTFYELQVEEVFKGKAPSGKTLIMRELGGVKEGIGMEVAGTAQFNRDEEVVVFLDEVNSDGSFDVHGMMMGKYNLEKDEEGNEVLAGAGVSATTHPYLRHSEHTVQKEGEAKKREKWTLETLRKLIQSQSPTSKGSPAATKPVSAKPSFPAVLTSPQSTSGSGGFEATTPDPSSTYLFYWMLGTAGFLILFWLFRSLFFS